jgi:hypothetical protein
MTRWGGVCEQVWLQPFVDCMRFRELAVGKSLNSSTWHSGEGAGVGGGRREFEPGQEQGIDGAEGCRAVAKWRRAAACVVRIRGWLP